jgi:NAD(P)-dependent dehydrogenase (short-subunit alcohol dehydrogenase family)
MGGPFMLTPQGFERQMASNHVGHAALIAALWPLLHASAARVVLVSSTEARDGQLSPQTTRERLVNRAPYDGRYVSRPTCCSRTWYTAEAPTPVRRSALSPFTRAPVRPTCSLASSSRPHTACWPSGFGRGTS